MKKKNLKAMGAACAAAILACSCGSSKNALQTSALEGEWNIRCWGKNIDEVISMRGEYREC